MTSHAYRRWAELYDRQLAGEALSPIERAELLRLSNEDRASAHELVVRRQLAELECELEGDHQAIDDQAIDDQAIVERALCAVQDRDKIVHLRKPTIPTRASSPPSRRWRAPALGAFALAAAASGATVFWPDASEESAPMAKSAAVELTLTSGKVRVNGKPTVVGALALEPKSTVSVTDGRACLALDPDTDVCLDANTEVVLDDQQGDARTLHLARGRAVAVLDKRPARRSFSVISGSVTATALGTAFAVEHDARGAIQITVMEGRVQVARTGDTASVIRAGEQLQNAHESGAGPRHTTRSENLRHWALVAPRKLWQAPSVGIVHLETTPQNAWLSLDGTALGSAPLSVVAASGEHQLLVELDGHAPQHERFRLTPGQERRFTLALPAPSELPDPTAAAPAAAPAPGPAAAPAPAVVDVPTPAELLKRARTLVGQGDWRGAAAAYQRLRTVYPKSPESHTVSVALGQLQLDRLGQPRQALRSFEAYLKAGGGGLAQEARYGSLRALRALGDRPAEAQAIRAYLRQYPKSVDAERLRRRLAELE